MEFPWGRGEVTINGTALKDVGIRYKGNASYMASSRGLKRSFKLDLDHFDERQRFHGLKTLNLNSGAMDPSKLREALSFSVLRAAGVPAPRTAFAEVSLTVPGQYDRELLGLYTLIEQVDKSFLKDHFGNGKGLLMKPERMPGLPYLGDDWDKYKSQLQPRREATKKEARRVIDFFRLIHQPDDQLFRREIGSYLDVDEFLRLVAVNALLANLDSMLSMGHNFYIYLHPDTNKFIFLPWDMDLSLAGFPMGGAPEQQLDLSVFHPHVGETKLIDRLLAIKEVRERYEAILKELTATCFTAERLTRDLEAMERVTKEIVARETKAAEARKEPPGGFGPGGRGPGPFGRSPDLRTFITKRTESVAAQLAGTSKGYVPTGMMFGPGGRPGGFGLGGFLAGPLLKGADTNGDKRLSLEEARAGARQLFEACDSEHKGAIDEVTLADGLGRLLPAPIVGGPFGPPPGGPGGPGQPGGPGAGPGGRPGTPPPAPGQGQGAMPPPPGSGAPPGPGGPGGPPGPGGPGVPGGPGQPGGPRLMAFNPGGMMARAILRVGDANGDHKLSLVELLAAVDKSFREWDKDKNGFVDEKELVEGLNGLAGPPPRFGPPGGPGGLPPGNPPPGPGAGPGSPPAPPAPRADAPGKGGGA
jgi:hypothetical protein